MLNDYFGSIRSGDSNKYSLNKDASSEKLIPKSSNNTVAP